MAKEITAFRANDNLRRGDTPVEYTSEQIYEIQKCADDPIYFIKNYCKIISLDEGLVKFNLYPYQEDFVSLIHNSTRIIAKWARQSGKSITSAAYLVWYVLFNEHKRVGILAHQASGAREILSRIQTIYESLPIWLQAGVIEWNKGSFELDNGSSIITAATASTGIRGKSCNIIFLDEIAFISSNEFEVFFSSVYPTIASSKDSKVIISSTPDGLNHFYKLWTEAVNGINGYVYQAINWYDPPGRDEKFKEKMIAEIGMDRWRQEFECDFLGASGAIIKSEVLKNIPVQNPIITQYDDKFRVFVEPKKDHQYVAICDVSEGIEKDSSTIQIIDLTNFPFEQVAVFQDNTMKSNLFHLTIDKIAKNYNEALVIVESNSIGKEVLNNLFYDAEYENLFRDDDFGIRTTKTVKNVGCSEMKYLVENSYLILKDYETISELSNFVRGSDGKIGAKKDHHDDLVMPIVLFSYFVNNKKLFNRYFDSDENGKINNIVIQKIDNELLPIGWVNDGHGIQNLAEPEEDTFGLFHS